MVPSSLPQSSRADREERRRLGIFYTPLPLAQHLVRAALGPLLPRLRRAARRSRRLDPSLLPRLLDPAMGDGVLLTTATDLIATNLSRAMRLPAGAVRPMVVARCVSGVDIDPNAVARAKRSLGEGAGRATLVRGDFLARRAPVAGSFDVVLGNPPWGGWNRGLGREVKAELRERFSTARGLIDPFALFIERSTTFLEPGGRLAMVLPDCFLLKNYPAVRRHVLSHYLIEELIHWGRAFPDVNLDVCTIVAARATSPARGHLIRCLPEGPGGRSMRAPQSRFAASPGQVFNLSLDARGAALLRRLEKRFVPLGDLLETHEGIHSGNIRSKLFVPPGGDGPPAGRLRPLVLGRNEIRPFRLRPAGWSVVRDPGAIDRSHGEYANLGRARWFSSKKILIRRTGDVVIAAVDRGGLCASNNLFVALARPGCPVPIEYVEGYLNSSLATWCFRAIQPRTGRLFAELKLVHLNRLPVPIPRGPRGRLALARIVKLVALLRRTERDGRSLLALLDESFARLAQLTPAETRAVARETSPPPGASPL